MFAPASDNYHVFYDLLPWIYRENLGESTVDGRRRSEACSNKVEKTFKGSTGLKSLTDAQVETALSFFARPFFAKRIVETDGTVVFQTKEIADTSTETGHET